MNIKKLATAALLAGGLTTQANAAPVDIAFIVDQSGSMSGEFAWIPTVIGEIGAALAAESAVDSVRYGVVGYMESPQTRDNGTALAYQDLTGSVMDVQNEVTGVPLYCCRESGYEAAYWAQTGFSWDANSVKIMVLLTDENGDQSSNLPDAANAGPESREEWLGNELDSNGFLLNVVTNTGRYSQWDDAVFDINDPGYTGLFDINQLRNNATQFTQDFVSAKVQEIIGEIPDPDPDPDPDPTPVPESGTLALLGLSALLLLRRRRTA